jgi:hypothetical protein
MAFDPSGGLKIIDGPLYGLGRGAHLVRQSLVAGIALAGFAVEVQVEPGGERDVAARETFRQRYGQERAQPFVAALVAGDGANECAMGRLILVLRGRGQRLY